MGSSFKEYVSRNRLFILGAGFSVAAGVPTMPNLLQATMARFRSECSGVSSLVDVYAAHAFGIHVEEIDYRTASFPELCTFLDYVELSQVGGGERWSDRGSRERLALKHYLGKTIARMTPEPRYLPAVYARFAKQLHPGDVVATFNWDCLLEAAMDACNCGYTYNFDAIDTLIQISKMHGSVHWRVGTESWYNPELPWVKTGLGERNAPGELYFSRDLMRFDAWEKSPPIGGEIEPFLVLPGFGKAYDIRALDTLWYKPGAIFAFTNDVYIIGLALNLDDFFVRSLLLANLPRASDGLSRKITIINPDPAVRRSFSFIPDGSAFQFRAEPFSEAHVDEMESRLASHTVP